MEDSNSAYTRSCYELAVAYQMGLRAAKTRISDLEKENKLLSGSVEARDAVIRDLRKELVGAMSNLDRPGTPEPPSARDRELKTIEQILNMLDEIKAAAGNAVSKRVLHYINQRHGL